jgi:hypothetical protein
MTKPIHALRPWLSRQGSEGRQGNDSGRGRNASHGTQGNNSEQSNNSEHAVEDWLRYLVHGSNRTGPRVFSNSKGSI